MKFNLTKKAGLSLLIVLLLCLGFSSVAFAGFNFTLVNKTGFDVYSVYITPSHEEDWGEDVMDTDVLANGDSVDIYYDGSTKGIVWDIMVRAKDGSEYEWNELKLSSISKVILYQKKGEVWAEWN